MRKGPLDPAVLARAAAGEPLDRHDLTALFGFSQSGYYKHAAEFERFKLTPAIGPRCYSGARVWRYLQGEDVEPAPAAQPWGRPRKVAR
jgi:hypothetical protein